MEWERKTWWDEYMAGERIVEIAERHRVSRKTLYKWLERYEAHGMEGLRELSRAPLAHPRQVGDLWRERVRSARLEHPRWGPLKLQWLLKKQHSGGGVPSASTIGRLLRDWGLSRNRGSRARARGTGALAEAEQPNQVWAIDFKGWCRTGDGARCEPLTVTDQATRYLLCCQGLPSTRTELVRPVMERIFIEYGLPQRIRSDNGAPFASNGECGLTELSVWWIELGIVCERIQPGHPQQNGRHERMHRTLQEATMSPPASTARQQQRRMDAFRQEYNEQRPHEALGQRVPAEVYHAAERRYPGVVGAPNYGTGWQVRKVSSCGGARWASGRMFVSHALEGKLVGFEPLDDGLWKMWFHGHWLGMWDEYARRYWRPHEWARQVARRALAGLASGNPPE
jgi:transposase InsO family protein